MKIPIEIAKLYYDQLDVDKVQIIELGDLIYIRKDKVWEMILDYQDKFGVKMPEIDKVADSMALSFQGHTKEQVELAMKGAYVILEMLFGKENVYK